MISKGELLMGTKKLRFILFLLAILMLTGCSSTTRIAIMTKLESGSLYGISEVDSAKFYLKNNGIENIEIIPYNDGWDPDRIESVYKEIREDGIDIIIASHPSSCALELLELVKNDKAPVIIFVTASTTDKLSGVNDNIFRVIQDVEQEQKSIAEHIAKEKYKDLLVIRNVENYGYTDPAIAYFDEYYDGNINVIDVSTSNIDLAEIKEAMEEYGSDRLEL